jgi:alpha-glucosidase (family GH31 glycosyl hydrolase)
MQRRTFLKDTAVGFGTLLGMCSGILNAESAASDAQLVDTLPPVIDGKPGEPDENLDWGANSIVLKSAWHTTPGIDDLLSDTEHMIILDDFFRVGGDRRPVSYTECRIGYNDQTFYVVFRCHEPHMSLPYANLDPKMWPQTHWDSLSGLPSGTDSDWPPFPDEIDLLIRSDQQTPSCFHFAATLQGQTFGCIRELFPGHASPAPAKRVDVFDANVIHRSDEWIVLFSIPWRTLGGKPDSHFGLLPLRTRWRDGEFTSPAALDFNESMPADLLIETHFAPPAAPAVLSGALLTLPSGTLRWRRAALLTYPSVQTCRDIWRMSSSLDTLTSPANLASRLYLTQRWMDLMSLEGFTPLPNAWGVQKYDLTLATFRKRVNSALEKTDVEQACKLLDTYLAQLNEMSRWWYADGSPGNLLANEWTPVTRLNRLIAHSERLQIQCRAGEHEVDLYLALPSTGGFRIFGTKEGFWRPAEYLPMQVSESSDACTIRTESGTILIQKNPFVILLPGDDGQPSLRIDAANVAFRFSSSGAVLAIDFRHNLDSDEVIYGFGEKYDHFDQNGHVLTLWGTDDWVGNWAGLANTTYKPLPILHSSKQYMLFSNSSYRLRADIGHFSPGHLRITQQGPILDWFFWVGTPENALKSYTALTGRVPLPPKWAFEPWMGRGEDAWAAGPLHDAVREEQYVTTRFAELDVPHSAIYAEGPSALSVELYSFMAARNIRVLGYFMPAIPPAKQQALLPQLSPDQLPILHCKTEQLTKALGYIDFSHPNAAELCRRELEKSLRLGEAGSMVDYGDMVPDSAKFHDGQHGAAMHNFYYYEYHKTISQLFREKRGDDFVLFARGAAPGTQHWLGQFAGDHPGNYEGLKHVVTGALNLCACGYSTWGSDIGGYFGFPQPDVYMRWVQFGCFSPLMRPHGTSPREPWHFGEEAVANYKFFAWTRENLLNYTYNAAILAHETGVPIMRSMPVAFPHDKNLASVDDQYMFGSALLVAPVVTEDALRTIHFPAGKWISLWDGEQVSGPTRVALQTSLNRIPVYLKAGAVMPVQLNSHLQFGSSMKGDQNHVLLTTFPAQDEDISLMNSSGTRAHVKMHLTQDGVRLSLGNLSEMVYLLIYGVSAASSIRVNGEEYRKTDLANLRSFAEEWAEDPANNRLILRLPSQVEHNSVTTEITVLVG